MSHRISPRLSPAPNRPEAGNALVIILVVVVLIAGFSVPMLLRSVGNQQSASAGMFAAKLLSVAESGLEHNVIRLHADPLYAVRDTAGFNWDAATQEFVSGLLTLGTDTGSTQQVFRYQLHYLNGTTPVVFADRTNPVERFDRIRVSCTVPAAKATRRVVAYYSFGLSKAFGGAVISDMHPLSGSPTGKSGAKLGNLVFDGKGRTDQHIVFGDLKANGQIRFDTSAMTTANAPSFLRAHRGEVQASLLGTDDEIPDYTSLGGPNQLFDFDRFEAAAGAGAGAVHNSIAAFEAAMDAANAAGEPLEGIHVLKIDPAVEGGSPKIDIAGGIRMTGTLVFRFAPGTDPLYKVVCDLPMSINAADLTGVTFNDEGTWTTGYPGVYVDPTKRPDQVNISPAFTNFTADSDYPALMFDNGVVDIHGPANICGVIYGPSFVEIENKHNQLQFVHGAVFGGGGVFFEANGTAGALQAIRFDPLTIDRLETKDQKGQVLTRTGFSVVQ
jgi:hypothetical protein